MTSPFQSRLKSVSRRSPPPSAPQTKSSAGASGSLAAKARVAPSRESGEAADDPLARDDPGDRAARGRDAVHAEAALVLRGHRDRAPVGAPERRDPERRAGAVEIRGEAAGRAARDRDREEADIVPEAVRRRSPQVGDRVAGGREGGVTGRPRAGGQAAGRAALGRHEPDVGGVVVIALVMADRREGDRAPVRRPRGIGVVEVALGELARLGALRGGHHEDLRAPVVGEALPVEPVLHGGDHARGLRLALVLLGRRLRRAAHPRREGQARPVRRPHRRAQAVPELGEANGLAPRGRHHVELALLRRLALGDEGQPGAVGRPARGGIPSRSGGEAAGLPCRPRSPPRCSRGTRPSPPTAW